MRHTNTFVITLMAGTALAMAAATGATSSPAGNDACWSQQFTAVDQTGDGMVSRQEARAFQQKLFEFVDMNGDGRISRLEYTDCTFGTSVAQDSVYRHAAGPRADKGSDAATQSSGKGSAMADLPKQGKQRDRFSSIDAARDQFRNVDTDKDQFVTRDEYMRAAEKAYKVGGLAMRAEDGTAGPKEGAPGIASDDYVGAMEPYGTYGAFADSNKDRRIMEPEAAIDVSNRFSRRDSDGDNRLSEREWIDSSRQAIIERRFKAIDSNNDGHISRKEYGAAERKAWDQAQAGTDQPMSIWHYRAIYVPVVIPEPQVK